MNGIENDTRFGGGSVGSADRDRGEDSRAREREREGENEFSPGENDISADGMAVTRHAEMRPGVEKQIYEQRGRANDVPTVRPTGAITGGILQSLRLYLVAREHLARLACLRSVLKIIAIRGDSCAYVRAHARARDRNARYSDCRQNRPSKITLRRCRQSKDRGASGKPI